MTRKVDNLLGLAVLSVVHERPMHRYEMATVIRERGKDRQMAVKWGSLYTVVQNLERHGFLEVTGSERDGARPERTIYAITAAGRQEIVDWTRDLIAEPQPEQLLFTAGLSVLAALRPDEVITLLRQRTDRLAVIISERRETLAATGTEIARLFLVEDEYAIAMLEAEARWVAGLIDELVDGRFPDLDQWRAMSAHTTTVH